MSKKVIFFFFKNWKGGVHRDFPQLDQAKDSSPLKQTFLTSVKRTAKMSCENRLIQFFAQTTQKSYNNDQKKVHV